ncbi:MAG: GNAT family N-acetyltransferase [Lachnospiraceae bacterium]|nr:GNAT family N-acetyltransferase [Lachnospiraceae bacterium]
MTNQDILNVAMQQSAIDSQCKAEDFRKAENVIVNSAKDERARRYLKLPFVCDMVTYGSNIVASIQPEYYDIVNSYLSKYDVAHCFETPNMHVLNDAFEQMGFRVCFMAEYFLPDINVLKPLECSYETRILEQADFQALYIEQWSNALCEDRKELDVLGVGAYENGNLIGLAACSADCDSMWQIGIDVLPEYRRKGIASSLTSKLAIEIIKRDKVPFYCCAWCNIKSARNAIKSGFRPAWAEMTVKPKEEVDKMNER